MRECWRQVIVLVDAGAYGPIERVASLLSAGHHRFGDCRALDRLSSLGP